MMMTWTMTVGLHHGDADTESFEDVRRSRRGLMPSRDSAPSCDSFRCHVNSTSLSTRVTCCAGFVKLESNSAGMRWGPTARLVHSRCRFGQALPQGHLAKRPK